MVKASADRQILERQARWESAPDFRPYRQDASIAPNAPGEGVAGVVADHRLAGVSDALLMPAARWATPLEQTLFRTRSVAHDQVFRETALLQSCEVLG